MFHFPPGVFFTAGFNPFSFYEAVNSFIVCEMVIEMVQSSDVSKNEKNIIDLH